MGETVAGASTLSSRDLVIRIKGRARPDEFYVAYGRLTNSLRAKHVQCELVRLGPDGNGNPDSILVLGTCLDPQEFRIKLELSDRFYVALMDDHDLRDYLKKGLVTVGRLECRVEGLEERLEQMSNLPSQVEEQGQELERMSKEFKQRYQELKSVAKLLADSFSQFATGEDAPSDLFNGHFDVSRFADGCVDNAFTNLNEVESQVRAKATELEECLRRAASCVEGVTGIPYTGKISDRTGLLQYIESGLSDVTPLIRGKDREVRAQQDLAESRAAEIGRLTARSGGLESCLKGAVDFVGSLTGRTYTGDLLDSADVLQYVESGLGRANALADEKDREARAQQGLAESRAAEINGLSTRTNNLELCLREALDCIGRVSGKQFTDGLSDLVDVVKYIRARGKSSAATVRERTSKSHSPESQPATNCYEFTVRPGQQEGKVRNLYRSAITKSDRFLNGKGAMFITDPEGTSMSIVVFESPNTQPLGTKFYLEREFDVQLDVRPVTDARLIELLTYTVATRDALQKRGVAPNSAEVEQLTANVRTLTERLGQAEDIAKDERGRATRMESALQTVFRVYCKSAGLDHTVESIFDKDGNLSPWFQGLNELLQRTNHADAQAAPHQQEYAPPQQEYKVFPMKYISDTLLGHVIGICDAREARNKIGDALNELDAEIVGYAGRIPLRNIGDILKPNVLNGLCRRVRHAKCDFNEIKQRITDYCICAPSAEWSPELWTDDTCVTRMNLTLAFGVPKRTMDTLNLPCDGWEHIPGLLGGRRDVYLWGKIKEKIRDHFDHPLEYQLRQYQFQVEKVA